MANTADGHAPVTATLEAPLLEVRDLMVHFPVGGGLFRQPRIVHAVDWFSFALR